MQGVKANLSKFWFVKGWQNLKTFQQRSFRIFNNTNNIIELSQ